MYTCPLRKKHLHARVTGTRALVISSSSCSSCLEKYPVDDEANVLRTIAFPHVVSKIAKDTRRFGPFQMSSCDSSCGRAICLIDPSLPSRARQHKSCACQVTNAWVFCGIMLLDACLAAANVSSTYSTKAATVSCHGYVSAQLLMLLFVASLKQSVHPYFSR